MFLFFLLPAVFTNAQSLIIDQPTCSYIKQEYAVSCGCGTTTSAHFHICGDGTKLRNNKCVSYLPASEPASAPSAAAGVNCTTDYLGDCDEPGCVDLGDYYIWKEKQCRSCTPDAGQCYKNSVHNNSVQSDQCYKSDQDGQCYKKCTPTDPRGCNKADCTEIGGDWNGDPDGCEPCTAEDPWGCNNADCTNLAGTSWSDPSGCERFACTAEEPWGCNKANCTNLTGTRWIRERCFPCSELYPLCAVDDIALNNQPIIYNSEQYNRIYNLITHFVLSVWEECYLTPRQTGKFQGL